MIAPDKVLHDEENGDAPLDAPRPGKGMRLETVAHYFDRRVVQVGTVTAIVPREMVVLNTHLKPPNLLDHLEPGEKLQMLEATFSASQWELIGSPNGIGLTDLSDRQQPLFLSLIPENSTVTTTGTKANAKGEPEYDPAVDAIREVSDDERQQVRLRVDRTSLMSLVSSAGQRRPWTVSALAPTSARSFFQEQDNISPNAADRIFGRPVRLHLANTLKPTQLDFSLPTLNPVISAKSANTVGDIIRLVRARTGVEVYVDGRLAQIPVYVKGTEVGIRSGDALKALCLALTCTIRKIGPSQTADAGGKGDVAYILTDDIQGLGAQQAIIGEWAERGLREKTMLEQKQLALIKSQNPLDHVFPAPGNPDAPTPEVMRKIEEVWAALGRNDYDNGAYVPVGLLSPNQRQAVQRALAQDIAQQNKDPQPGWVAPDPGKVCVNLALTLTYIVPGFGDARSGTSYMTFDLIPESKKHKLPVAATSTERRPATGPKVVSEEVLAVAPHSVEETTEFMDLAKAKGFREVWIQAPDSPAGRAMLADAIAAGAHHGITVTALVPLMAAREQSPAPEPDKHTLVTQAAPKFSSDMTNQLLDLNLLGETGSAFAARWRNVPVINGPGLPWANPEPRPSADVLAPEAAVTLLVERERMKRIATLPGIAGIALKETSEPGHALAIEGNSQVPDADESAGSFGYTIANRLRFLRKSGYDPIDLPPSAYFMAASLFAGTTTLPFIDTDGSGHLASDTPPVDIDPGVVPAWNTLRSESQTKLLHTLFGDIQKLKPDLPIVAIAGPRDMPSGGGWYAPWTDAGAKAESAIEQNSPAPPDYIVKQPSEDVAAYQFAAGMESEFLQVLLRYAEVAVADSGSTSAHPVIGKPAPNVILDATAIPIAEIIRVLRGGIPDASR